MRVPSSVRIYHAGGFTNQRALPDPEQQRFQLREMLRPKLGAPLAFDVPKNLMARGLIRRIGPGKISEPFQTPEQLVHRLFAHAGTFREQRGKRDGFTRTRRVRAIRHLANRWNSGSPVQHSAAP
jgi:hypothetical protein